MNRSEQAAVYFLGLSAGIVSAEEIIAWCDFEIEADEQPDAALIELSTTNIKSKARILEELGILRKDIGHFDALRLLLPLLKERIEVAAISPEAAAKFTARYSAERLSEMPRDLIPLYNADDEFHVAELGGNRDEVVVRFLKALDGNIRSG